MDQSSILLAQYVGAGLVLLIGAIWFIKEKSFESSASLIATIVGIGIIIRDDKVINLLILDGSLSAVIIAIFILTIRPFAKDIRNLFQNLGQNLFLLFIDNTPAIMNNFVWIYEKIYQLNNKVNKFFTYNTPSLQRIVFRIYDTIYRFIDFINSILKYIHSRYISERWYKKEGINAIDTGFIEVSLAIAGVLNWCAQASTNQLGSFANI